MSITSGWAEEEDDDDLPEYVPPEGPQELDDPYDPFTPREATGSGGTPSDGPFPGDENRDRPQQPRDPGYDYPEQEPEPPREPRQPRDDGGGSDGSSAGYGGTSIAALVRAARRCLASVALRLQGGDPELMMLLMKWFSVSPTREFAEQAAETVYDAWSALGDAPIAIVTPSTVGRYSEPEQWLHNYYMNVEHAPSATITMDPVLNDRGDVVGFVMRPPSDWYIALYPPFFDLPELQRTRILHEAFHMLDPERFGHGPSALDNAYCFQGFVSEACDIPFNEALVMTLCSGGP